MVIRMATTISVKESTRDLLQFYGFHGESNDEIVRRLLMEVYPPEFVRELERRYLDEERIPLKEVKARLKLK
jgi:hypothetical protein